MQYSWLRRLSGLSKALERIAKLTASALGVIALFSFLFPPLGNLVETFAAWRFGAVGYVYYEIKDNLEPTTEGDMFLLQAGNRDFDDVRFGSKLQVMDGSKNFRTEPKMAAPKMFFLKAGQCVVVISKGAATEVTVARSGGWLFVATSGCGLFG